METHLTPSERAELLRNINMKQVMLFGIAIDEDMYNDLHDMSDSALFGISLALTLLIIKVKRER